MSVLYFIIIPDICINDLIGILRDPTPLSRPFTKKLCRRKVRPYPVFSLLSGRSDFRNLPTYQEKTNEPTNNKYELNWCVCTVHQDFICVDVSTMLYYMLS